MGEDSLRNRKRLINVLSCRIPIHVVCVITNLKVKVKHKLPDAK